MNMKALRDLSSKMKRKLATGGTVTEDGTILLQGDHREKVAKLLQEEGYPPTSIEII